MFSHPLWQPLDWQDEFIVRLFAANFGHNKPQLYQTKRHFPGIDNPLVGTAYLQNGSAPLIVVFPILAGSHHVSMAMARFFAKQGFHVLRINKLPWLLPGQPISQLISYVRNLLDFTRTLMDELSEQVPISGFGCAGVSMGSILTAMLAHEEPRLSVIQLTLGGGEVPSLLWNSQEPVVVSYREAYIKEHDATEASFLTDHRILAEQMEPARQPAACTTSHIQMINGIFDRVIPRYNQDILWQAMGRPKRFMLPCGHYSIALFFPWVLRRMAGHFKRAFADK